MNIKLLAKQMLLGLSTTALGAAGFFGVKSANDQYAQMNQQQDSVSAYADSSFVPRPSNTSPDELYMMATLASPFASGSASPDAAFDDPILSYIDGLQDAGVLTTDMEELYIDKYTSISAWANFPNFLPMPGVTEQAAQQAFQQVASVDWQNDSYNIINQFSDVAKTEVLEVKTPSTVVDVYSKGAMTVPNNFAYKLAEINVDDVPAEEGDIVFSYSNTGNTSGGEKVIVLSNRNGELNTLASQPDLDDYIDTFGIFVRDLEVGNAFDPTTMGPVSTLSNQLNFVYEENPNTSVKTISIWAQPGANTIEFGVHQQTASPAEGAFTFGFLDSSLSPYQVAPITSATESSPSSPNVTEDPIAGSASTIAVHEQSSLWAPTLPGEVDNINQGEHLRFFMAPYTEWEAEVYYKGMGSDAFESQNNILRLVHNGQALEQYPASFQIKQESFLGGSEPIYIKNTVKVVDGKNWIQVDMVLPEGDVQLSPPAIPGVDQDPYRLIQFNNEILYNIDGTFDPGWATNGGYVELVQQTNQDDLYQEILGDLYVNWSRTPGYDNPSSPERYIVEDKIKFPDRDGIESEGYDWFQNSFDSFYLDEGGGIVANPTTSSNGMDLPIVDIATGEFERDANGDLVYQLTTGQNIVDVLTTTTNLLAQWSVTKLGADPETVRENDFYRIMDSSKSISFVQNNIINNSGARGNDMAVAAEALTRYWSGDLLTQAQAEIIADMDAAYPGYNISTTIKDIGMPGSGWGVNDPIWQTSRQYIYHIIQPYMAAAIQELFVLEINTFDNLKGSVLGIHMSAFLNTSDSGDSGINMEALQILDSNEFPESIQNLSLIALNGTTTTTVANGAESLGSLVEFLDMFMIDGKYLESQREQEQFSAYVQSGMFTDPLLYQDPNRQSDIREMIALLDTIISNGDFKTDETKTLSDIVNDIISLKNTNPLEDLRVAIQSVTNAIASNRDAVIHEFFGTEYGTTILENLVIGRNLRAIITEYKDRLVADDGWEDLTQDQQNAVDAGISGSYDPKTITQVGINMGYYNLSSFLTGLSVAQYVPGTAKEILSSDLLNNLTFEIPESNAFVDLISDSSVLYRYSSMFAGAVLFIISVSTLGMTFRKSARRHQTARSLLIFRLSFVTVGLIGLAIGASGILIGAL